MSFTSTLADAVAKIKSGYLRRERYVYIRRSNFLIQILKVLYENKLIVSFFIVDQDSICVFLKYRAGQPFLLELSLVSKPGWKKYLPLDKLLKTAKCDTSSGFYVISTDLGIMTSTDAKFLTKKISGKVLLKVLF